MKNNINCLISGACGFIGSHLTDKLLELGYHVTTVDDCSSPVSVEIINRHVGNPKAYTFISDFASEKILNKIKSGQFSHVFHLAALTSVPESVEQSAKYYDVNVTKTLKLIEACKTSKTTKIIFSSSSAVYGSGVDNNDECDSSLDPMSPYALQKLTIENYLKLYKKLYGLDSVSLRYFNVYGPRQRASGAYANVIGAWSAKIAKSKPIKLYGDGTVSRDFVNVKDVVRANISAAFKPTENHVYNVGTGLPVSLLDLIELYRNLGYRFEIEQHSERTGEPRTTKASTEKLEKEFGLQCKPIDKLQLCETVNWYIKEFYRPNNE